MPTYTDERSRSAILIALLIDDVIAARNRLAGADSQTARRDVVRATLAAMEGYFWEVRQHVASTLAELEELTPTASLALLEISVVSQFQISC